MSDAPERITAWAYHNQANHITKLHCPELAAMEFVHTEFIRADLSPQWQTIDTMPEMRRLEPFIGALQLSSGVWEQYVLFCDDETWELHYSCGECGWSFEDFTHWKPLGQPPT